MGSAALGCPPDRTELSVRIGHVTGSSRVFLYDFGSYTIIQLAVVPRTSVVAIKCSRFSLSVS